MISVSWDIGQGQTYKVMVEVTCADRPGLLSELMIILSESKTNASSVNARAHKDKTATVTFILDITNTSQLESIMTKLRRAKDVYSVYRVKQSKGGIV